MVLFCGNKTVDSLGFHTILLVAYVFSFVFERVL
jgi:hypothetical protein